MRCTILLIIPLLSLSSSIWAQNSINLQLINDYLHFPVSFKEEDDIRLELIIDGEVAREFDIFLADSDPDFWVFLDIRQFKEEKAKLRTHTGKENKGLNLVYQSDDRIYLENVYNEKFRPQLHFSSMRGWLNDPNGLVYYDGEYHLFYQHNPYGIEWGNMHWGHAISKDLIHWEQLPEALYPDKRGVAFSGSALIDYNNTSGFKSGDNDVMVAIYTSTFIPNEKQEKEGLEAKERQSLAYSNDNGRTWKKYEGNPVIGLRREELNSWNDRDPNVFWHKATQKWVMIIFEKIGLSIFTSDNLKEWNHESYFESFWECPELFQLPVDGNKDIMKWVVYDAGGDYVIGDFDGKNFTIEEGPFTYIDGEFFAAQTFENIPDSDGRQIQIGWGTIETEGMPFNMMMTFPTVLTLRNTEEGVRMFNEPINEISSLHSKAYNFNNLSFEEANIVLKDIKGELLHLKFEVENINTMNYGLRIGDDRISYSIRDNRFSFNEEAFTSKYLPHRGSKKIKYEIIVDRTSIEVFVDEGRFTMVLPRNLNVDRKGLEFWLDNGTDLQFKILDIYELKSIWK
jgi:sucrose-6-phosphate hydrolase SacC (GH32 family)